MAYEYEMNLKELGENLNMSYSAIGSICLNYRLSSYILPKAHPLTMRINPKSIKIMEKIVNLKTSAKKYMYLYNLGKFKENLEIGEVKGKLVKLGGEQ